MGFIQGHVPHAVHRLWTVPTPESNRHVAHSTQHDQWRHLLRPLSRAHYQSYTITRFLQTTVQRK
ncbi:hypothetical protein TNCV_2221421, partial [Trichonephila clavipes]